MNMNHGPPGSFFVSGHSECFFFQISFILSWGKKVGLVLLLLLVRLEEGEMKRFRVRPGPGKTRIGGGLLDKRDQ